MELRAQLHMHTTESRGTRVKMHSSIHPKTAIDVLKKKNVQVLAITDHDNTRAYSSIKGYAGKRGIMLINGIEISTRDGEIIGLNIEPGIEKKLNKKMSVYEARDIILDYNGEILIPHPFDVMGNGIGEKIKQIKGIVEVFNSGNIFGFEDRFARLAAEKLNMPIVACSDAHYLKMIDRGITIVDAEPNIDSIINAIKKRRVKFDNCKYVTWSEIKEWALLRISSSYSDIIKHLENGWDPDAKYMKIANLTFMRLIEKKTLELGISNSDSKIWDIISHIIFFITSLYAWRAKREYAPFVFSI